MVTEITHTMEVKLIGYILDIQFMYNVYIMHQTDHRGNCANCIHLPQFFVASPRQQHPRQPLTSPHPHTPTHETNKRPPKQNTEIKILPTQRKRHKEHRGGSQASHAHITAWRRRNTRIEAHPRTPQIPHYTAIRTDREHKQGGRLPTLSQTQHSHASRRHKPSTRTTQKYNY